MKRALLALTVFVAACAGREKPPLTPIAISEVCSQAQANVLRVLRKTGAEVAEDEEERHERLQAVIGEMKIACNLVNEDAGDVIHVLIEEIARRTELSCEMLKDINSIPKVGRIPMLWKFTKKCGRRDREKEKEYYPYVVSRVFIFPPQGKNDLEWSMDCAILKDKKRAIRIFRTTKSDKDKVLPEEGWILSEPINQCWYFKNDLKEGILDILEEIACPPGTIESLTAGTETCPTTP